MQTRTDGARWEYEVAVNEKLCAACGICVGSCHSSNPFRSSGKVLETGIDMPQFPIDEVRSRTKAALDALTGETRLIVFGCDHAFDAAELKSRNIAAMSFLCTGMVPPTLVEYALKNGADGVFITGCRNGDCYYRYGNVWMDKRFNEGRKPMLRERVDRSRIHVFRAAVTDGRQIKNELAGFSIRIAALQNAPVNSASGEDGNA